MSGFDIFSPGNFPDPRVIGEGLRIDLPGAGSQDSPSQEIEGGDEISRTSFSSHLEDVFGEITRLKEDVADKYAALARGEPGAEVHDLMIAMGKSEVAFNLMLEMRNKIVEAWQTISRSVV